MESRTPKPSRSRAEQQAIPRIIISRRDRYRNMLRTDTFWRKVSRRHSGAARSRSTRFPAFGAFGRMREAGTSPSSRAQETQAVSRIHASLTRNVRAASSGGKT